MTNSYSESHSVSHGAFAPSCFGGALAGRRAGGPSSLVLLAALLLVLALLLGRGVLVLLVLRDEVVHVRLGLGKLHLVHALAGVPVEERLAAEYAGELLGDALHHLLHAGGVAAEADRHLEALRRDVADRALHVVRDPLDEVRRVLVLHVEHLL